MTLFRRLFVMYLIHTIKYINISFSVWMFFDREQRLKVLKEALLLLLFFLVAWNHEQKRFQMEQKMFQMEQKIITNKKCSKWNKKCFRTKNHHEPKMFQMEPKMCKGTKNVKMKFINAHWEQSVIFYDTLWYWIAVFA